jgi:hypothetical protein
MRHKTKPESKVQAATEQYKVWKEKHELEHGARMGKLASKQETSAEFFAKQARASAAMRRGPQAPMLPKPIPVGRVRLVSGIDESEMSLEELEALRKREAAAQAEIDHKKTRTGAVYNKGNPVYISDGMLEDLKAGSHRRR